MENSWVSGVSGAREREKVGRERVERESGTRERGVRGERKGEVSGAKD